MDGEQSGKPIEIPSRGRPRKRDMESFLHASQTPGGLGDKSSYDSHRFFGHPEPFFSNDFQQLQGSMQTGYMHHKGPDTLPGSIDSLLGPEKPFSRPGHGEVGGAGTQGMTSTEQQGYGAPGKGGPADYQGGGNTHGRRGGDGESGPPGFPPFGEDGGLPKASQGCSPDQAKRMFPENMFGGPSLFGGQGMPWYPQQDFSKGCAEQGRYEHARKGMGEAREFPGTHAHHEAQAPEHPAQMFRSRGFQARMGPVGLHEGMFANGGGQGFHDRKPHPYAQGEQPRMHVPNDARGYPYLGGFHAPGTFGGRDTGQDYFPHGGQGSPRSMEGDYEGRMMASLFPGGLRTHPQQRYMDVSGQTSIWMNRKKRKSNPLLWQYIKSNQGLHPSIVHPSKYSSLDFIQGTDDSQKMYLGAVRKSPPERGGGNSIFPLFLNSNKGVTDEFREVVQNFRASVGELDFGNVTVQQLKGLMKEFGLNHTGKKNELIERLQDILKKIDGKEAHRPEEQPQERPREADDFEFYFF